MIILRRPYDPVHDELSEAHEGDEGDGVLYFQMHGEARLLSYTREVEGVANNEIYTDNFRGVTDNTENGGGATDEEEVPCRRLEAPEGTRLAEK